MAGYRDRMNTVSMTLKISRYVYNYRWWVVYMYSVRCYVVKFVCIIFMSVKGVSPAYPGGFLHKKYGWNIGENGI